MQNFHQHNKIFAGNLYPAQKCGKIRLTKSKPVLFFYFEKENRIMILAIDIGNTTVALGGIRDGRVCFVARMDTVRTRTAAEYRAEMDKIFAHRRHPERPMRFEGAVLTSVVPQITGALAECARHYTGKKPVIVSPDIRTGLTMGVDEPRAVGKDRLGARRPKRRWAEYPRHKGAVTRSYAERRHYRRQPAGFFHSRLFRRPGETYCLAL